MSVCCLTGLAGRHTNRPPCIPPGCFRPILFRTIPDGSPFVPCLATIASCLALGPTTVWVLLAKCHPANDSHHYALCHGVGLLWRGHRHHESQAVRTAMLYLREYCRLICTLCVSVVSSEESFMFPYCPPPSRFGLSLHAKLRTDSRCARIQGNAHTVVT